MRAFFKNRSVHRAVYIALLLLWALVFRHNFGCLACMSRYGLPYWELVLPVALVLLLQVIFDNRILWWLFLAVSLVFAFRVSSDEYNWAKSYQEKAAWSGWEIGIHVGFVVFVCLTFLWLLFAIRPLRRKTTEMNSVPQAQQIS